MNFSILIIAITMVVMMGLDTNAVIPNITTQNVTNPS